MTRSLALAGFLLRDLHRSPAGAAPYGLAAALWWLTFYYPVDSDYLGAVGGWDLAIVAMVTTLLLAGRANRAALFPLLGRLQRRAELLAAIALASAAVTLLIGIGFVGLVIATGRLTDGSAATLWLAPRWLLVLALAVACGLNLSRLVARGRTYLAFAVIGAALATATGWRRLLPDALMWAGDGASRVVAPVVSLMGGGAAPLDPWPAAAVAGYAIVLAATAGLLFARKDLTWPE